MKHLRSSLLKSGRQPVQTFIQTITSGSTTSLNIPLTMTQAVKTQLISHFSCRHGVRQILLVGKDQQDRFTQLILVQHTVQLVASSVNTVTIVGVNHEDKTLRILVVVAPQRTNLILSSDVPHGEADVLVFHSFDVETNGRDGGDNLTKLELVQDSGLQTRKAERLARLNLTPQRAKR